MEERWKSHKERVLYDQVAKENAELHVYQPKPTKFSLNE